MAGSPVLTALLTEFQSLHQSWEIQIVGLGGREDLCMFSRRGGCGDSVLFPSSGTSGCTACSVNECCEVACSDIVSFQEFSQVVLSGNWPISSN